MRVLLVEDNEHLALFAQAILSEIGAEPTWAANGAAALAALERDRCAFDLVFTDFLMPGMTGVDLAKEIGLRWPDLPIVLTSGYGDALGDRARNFAYLGKPYTMAALQKTLSRALVRHSSEVQPGPRSLQA